MTRRDALKHVLENADRLPRALVSSVVTWIVLFGADDAELFDRGLNALDQGKFQIDTNMLGGLLESLPAKLKLSLLGGELAKWIGNEAFWKAFNDCLKTAGRKSNPNAVLAGCLYTYLQHHGGDAKRYSRHLRRFFSAPDPEVASLGTSLIVFLPKVTTKDIAILMARSRSNHKNL